MPTAAEEKAQRKQDAKEFLERVSALPHEQAKLQFGARIRGFLPLPPPERKAAIANQLDALAELNEDARVKIVGVRTELLMEIPKEHRKLLLGTMAEIVHGWTPERKRVEQRAVVKATQNYMFLKRMMIRSMFNKMVA